jgi:hypothetical protein
MFHGLDSCMPSSVAKRTDPGRHTFFTLKVPSQLGESLCRPSQFRIRLKTSSPTRSSLLRMNRWW